VLQLSGMGPTEAGRPMHKYPGICVLFCISHVENEARWEDDYIATTVAAAAAVGRLFIFTIVVIMVVQSTHLVLGIDRLRREVSPSLQSRQSDETYRQVVM